ncbi:MAG: hypothetical protein H6836_08655 [Planctomycetes bacterium]|nr:hypothetical protein [Planctomycetota bacterium]
MDECRLCGARAPLVQSHIVPKSFYGPLRLGQKLLSNTPGQRPRRSPTGEYDRIVCAECEARFSDYDNYAYRVFEGDLWNPVELPDSANTVAAFLLNNVKPDRLKLFAMSVLWRAHASQRSIFASVSLAGEVERELRSMILDDRAGSLDEFATILHRWVPPHTSLPRFMSPVSVRICGSDYYQLHAGLQRIYVRPGRECAKELQPVALHVNGSLLFPGRVVMIARPFIGSQDLKIATGIVRCNPDAFPRATDN